MNILIVSVYKEEFNGFKLNRFLGQGFHSNRYRLFNARQTQKKKKKNHATSNVLDRNQIQISDMRSAEEWVIRPQSWHFSANCAYQDTTFSKNAVIAYLHFANLHNKQVSLSFPDIE